MPVMHAVSPDTDTDVLSLVVEPKVSAFERWKTVKNAQPLFVIYCHSTSALYPFL